LPFWQTRSFVEEERCDQRVMPNCGGVPSTPFFCFTARANSHLIQMTEESGGIEEQENNSRLLRLSRLDPEAFVPALPASSRPYGVPRIAIHADLLDEVPGLGLGKSCHARSSGATNRIAIYNDYGLPGIRLNCPLWTGHHPTSCPCRPVPYVRAGPPAVSFHLRLKPS